MFNTWNILHFTNYSSSQFIYFTSDTIENFSQIFCLCIIRIHFPLVSNNNRFFICPGPFINSISDILTSSFSTHVCLSKKRVSSEHFNMPPLFLLFASPLLSLFSCHLYFYQYSLQKSIHTLQYYRRHPDFLLHSF